MTIKLWEEIKLFHLVMKQGKFCWSKIRSCNFCTEMLLGVSRKVRVSSHAFLYWLIESHHKKYWYHNKVLISVLQYLSICHYCLKGVDSSNLSMLFILITQYFSVFTTTVKGINIPYEVDVTVCSVIGHYSESNETLRLNQ